MKPIYLIDKSAWEQRRYVETAKERISELQGSKQLAISILPSGSPVIEMRSSEGKKRISMAVNEDNITKEVMDVFTLSSGQITAKQAKKPITLVRKLLEETRAKYA